MERVLVAYSKYSMYGVSICVGSIHNALRIHWERVVNSPKTFGARCESFETVGLFNSICSPNTL